MNVTDAIANAVTQIVYIATHRYGISNFDQKWKKYAINRQGTDSNNKQIETSNLAPNNVAFLRARLFLNTVLKSCKPSPKPKNKTKKTDAPKLTVKMTSCPLNATHPIFLKYTHP
jgi:hypothetical protein